MPCRGMTWLASLVAVLILIAVGAPLHGQSLFEKLVMPGPLVAAHKDLEKDCTNCHAPFEKGGQDKLCLACHKPVAADIANSTGFHGRSVRVAAQRCKHCHTDHKGRRFDIVLLDPETFDHGQTDFALEGAHVNAACARCHVPGAAFRQARSRCIDCHRPDDPHRGRLGGECHTCHEPARWLKLKPFDHDATRFPLTGGHTKVACKSCHGGEIYAGLGRRCVTCHSIQDVHKGRFGDKCESCHTPRKWADILFDHGRDTNFELTGKHARTKCASCHKGHIYKEKLTTACIACHRRADPHGGQLGAQCDDCHGTDGWRTQVAFDHDVTNFPLIGLHSVVPCEDCHTSHKYKDAKPACAACHRDRFHAGRLGPECETCHNPNGWRRWRFDHNRQTRYPLAGRHVGVKCHACHKTKAVKTPRLDTRCIACHRRDDIHEGRFQTACRNCHGVNGWRPARFDHNRQTRFTLDGAHARVGCHGCHRQRNAPTAKLDTACIACHGKDDVHRGQFGRKCDQCHITDTFKRVRMGN